MFVICYTLSSASNANRLKGSSSTIRYLGETTSSIGSAMALLELGYLDSSSSSSPFDISDSNLF